MDIDVLRKIEEYKPYIKCNGCNKKIIESYYPKVCNECRDIKGGLCI